MSPDGYISITGRIKDLIIRGGENIHPLEIENCLLSHPEVSEVSVVGVPDERYGEAVAAFVVPLDAALRHEGEEGKHRTAITAKQIREWVREKLSNHLGRPFNLLLFRLLIFVALFEVRADLPAHLLLVPKYVFFLSDSSLLPKTASGKIQKFKLEETAIKLLKDGSNPLSIP